MEPARLHLHGDLVDLVRRPRPRGRVVDVPVPSPRSVKDAIESVGVPHTEVGAIAIDGADAGWDRLLRGGEVVQVHPVDTVDAHHSGVTPPPLARPVRFVADVHLGTLARRLRVVGIDTSWRNDATDDELVACMLAEDRVLLTRDRGLLMRRAVVHGALVRHDDPDHQLVEVAARFSLGDHVAPGTRCPRCNGVLEPADPDDVAADLEPGTRAAGHESFGRCPDCRRLYWSGAHADAIEDIVDRVR